MLIDRLSFLTGWMASGLAALIPSFKKPAQEKVQWLKPTDNEDQLQIQLAGCLMAAEGSRDAHAVKQGDWAWSPALEAVTQLFADRQMASHEALGWMYGYACGIQKSGVDIRKIPLPSVLKDAARDLGWNDDLRFLRCPQCSKRLVAYRAGDEVTFKLGSFITCVDCKWELAQNAERPT